MKTLHGVAQFPVKHDPTTIFLRYGFMLADSWQEAQTAASIHWADVEIHRNEETGEIEGTRTLAYSPDALLRNLHTWNVNPRHFDPTLPAVAEPLPADYCRHCGHKACPQPCFLEQP